MIVPDELKAAARAVMAARRERLGDPPTPERLLAYKDGLLDDVERQEVEEKIAAFPEAARALADLEAFPDVDAAEGVEEISDEELAAHWLRFHERITTGEARPAEVIEIAERKALAPRRWPSLSRLAAAAILAFGLGLGSGLVIDRAVREPLPPAAVNVTIAYPEPEGTAAERSSVPTVVELPESAGAWVLVLGLVDGPAGADYSATIEDPQGVEVWTADGLRPTAAGTFHLVFRRDFLPPGDYRLSLHVGDGVVASYVFRLVESATDSRG